MGTNTNYYNSTTGSGIQITNLRWWLCIHGSDRRYEFSVDVEVPAMRTEIITNDIVRNLQTNKNHTTNTIGILVNSNKG